MAQWRKVVVAGSSPEFNGATLSGDLTVAGVILYSDQQVSFLAEILLN
jgi:hypothetical protein